jgi:uncharacterized protein
MKPVPTIVSVDWSARLHAMGDVVEDAADIAQCMGIIVTTPKGSDPLRPTFGCDAWKWLDKPAPDAIPRMVRDVADAIGEWEPRAQLLSVDPSPVAGSANAPAHWLLVLNWRIKGDAQIRIDEVRL